MCHVCFLRKAARSKPSELWGISQRQTWKPLDQHLATHIIPYSYVGVIQDDWQMISIYLHLRSEKNSPEALHLQALEADSTAVFLGRQVALGGAAQLAQLGDSLCKFMVHVWLVKCKVHSQLSIFHYYVWNMICKHKYGIHRFHPIPDLSGGVHLTSHQKWKKITWDNRKATKKATRSEWGMIIGRLPAWRLVDLCTKPTISMKEDPQLEAKFWCENQSCKVLIRCPLSLLGAQSLYVKDGERSQVAPDRKPQNVAQYPTVWSRFFLVRISPRFFPIIPSFLRFLLEIQEYPWISQKFPKKNHETQPSTAAFSIQGAAAISTALEVSQATRRLTVLRWMLRFRPFFLSDFEWL